MKVLLNNTAQTFRALRYVGEGESLHIEAVKVPPGFTELSDDDYEFFKLKNPRPLDCKDILVNEKNKVHENRTATPVVDPRPLEVPEVDKPIEVITKIEPPVDVEDEFDIAAKKATSKGKKGKK